MFAQEPRAFSDDEKRALGPSQPSTGWGSRVHPQSTSPTLPAKQLMHGQPAQQMPGPSHTQVMDRGTQVKLGKTETLTKAFTCAMTKCCVEVGGNRLILTDKRVIIKFWTQKCCGYVIGIFSALDWY